MTAKAKQAIDWVRIQAEYAAGDLSYRELAAKHGVSFQQLRQRGRRGHWADDRRVHTQRIATEIRNKNVVSRVTERAEWDSHDLRMAKVVRAKLSMRLAKIRDDSPDPADGLRELHAIVVAAEACQRIARLALGAVTEHLGVSRHEPPANSPTLRDWYRAVEELEAEHDDNGEGDDDGTSDPSQNGAKGSH